MWAWLACATPDPERAALLADASGSTPTEHLDGAPADSGLVDPYPRDEPVPELWINEVLPDNAGAFEVDGAWPDWVELYNPSGGALALDRVTLQDDSGRVWMGEGEIAGYGYLLLIADGGEGEEHAPFALDADGDHLTLAVDGVVTDRLSTGSMDAGLAWGRFPDGGAWSPTITLTPGATNGPTPSETLDQTEQVFATDTLHVASVELDEEARVALLGDPSAYVEATFSFDGARLDPVGLRLRGNSTFQDIDGKCSMRLDMNRYADLRLRSLDRLQLVNLIWDASAVREHLSYALFRALDVPAPRTAHAWVEVNGAPRGLYGVLEAYDGPFLDRWFGGSEGYLWEPGRSDLTGDATTWDCEEGEPCDATLLEPVAALLADEATDANVAALESVLDLERALRLIAGEIAVGQWDGYCAPNNWRLYWDPDSGLLTLLPSSMDLTFDSPGFEADHDYFACGGELLGWCLDNAGCEARYLGILEELADGLDESDEVSFALLAVLDDAALLIDTAASEDAALGLDDHTYEDHAHDLATLRRYLLDEPARIREQIDAR